jgi:YD repeat-containing protein
MTSHTNALGLVSNYAWTVQDGVPRVAACWSSEGERAEFTYDLAARRTSVRDELGREAHWTYDEHHQIVACTDLDGGGYTMEYDAAGQPTRIDLPGERSIAFEYDAAGRIIAETDPLGRRTGTTYDGNSVRASEVTTPDGARWRAAYDHLGRMLATIDPLQRTERYEYAEGLSPFPIARIDARGGRQAMTWNALGLMTAYTDCSGKTTRYAYDAAGYLASVTDALGNHTRFERLPTGEPVRIVLPDGTVQESTYDAAGLLIAQRYGPSEGRWLRNSRGQVV